MKLQSNQIVKTITNRETTPFPKFKSNAKTVTRLLLKVDEWLLLNAIEEAKAIEDDFNLFLFERIKTNES